MQIRDHTPHTAPVPFQLPRPAGPPLILQLRPLPLGFHEQLHARGLTPPLPPSRVARDSSGRPLRDESGNALLLSDTNSPAFLQARELYHQRVAVLVVYESLRADDSITFDTPPPPEHTTDSTRWADFADSLYRELQQAAFTAGDLILICQEVCRLSNLLEDHLRQAHASFFSPPPPPES